MKRIFPIILAAIVFIVALIMLRPAPSRVVVVAAHDLRAGHVLTSDDLNMMSVPDSVLAPDVITDQSMLVGQPLRIDRGQGDVIRASQIGNLIQVKPDERAIAVDVTDYSGVAGLLEPGQAVGVVASIPKQDTGGETGTFSKATIEGLRVLYIDPTFAANQDANTVPQNTPGPLAAGINTQERAHEGAVLLAVPTNLQTILYDFTSEGGISQTRTVNALELLAALSTTDGAGITLYLMPQQGTASNFTSPGLWLPDLITTPGPTPTPAPPIAITPTP